MEVRSKACRPLCALGMLLAAGCSGGGKPSIPPPNAPVTAQQPPLTIARNAPPPAPTVTQFAAGGPLRRVPAANFMDGSTISIHISTSPGTDPANPNDLPTSPSAVDGSLTNSEGKHAAVDGNEPSNVTIPNSSVIVEELTDDDPDDNDAPDVSPTVQEIEVLRPAADEYTLHVKGLERGVYGLEIYGVGPDSNASHVSLETVPAYPGSLFEPHMVCMREPSFEFDIDHGGLEPPHGAFSFAQPLTPEVRLPSEEKVLGLVIYYDPAIAPSSFRAFLDGKDESSRFHVKAGELELVRVPVSPGERRLSISAKNQSGQTAEQDFHIQH